VLPGAEQIAELQVDHFGLVVFDELEEIAGGFDVGH
jgi:hypothetical protein